LEKVANVDEMKETFVQYLEQNLDLNQRDAFAKTVREKGKNITMAELIDAVWENYAQKNPRLFENMQKVGLNADQALEGVFELVFNAMLNNNNSPEVTQRIQRIQSAVGAVIADSKN
jgi:hypothetical protein